MAEIICTCCMGTGAHEQYFPEKDSWWQSECWACEGKGYITPERSMELWRLSMVVTPKVNQKT